MLRLVFLFLSLFADFVLRWPAFPILSCCAAPWFWTKQHRDSVFNGEKQITEEPRLSSFGYVHWFAYNPSALEGEYDKVKSLVVKRLSHPQVANAGSLMGSEIKFGVAGASNSKDADIEAQK